MTLTYFIRSGLPDSKLLFLARPRKSNQKEGRPKTRCDLQSQFPRIKRKIGADRRTLCVHPALPELSSSVLVAQLSRKYCVF